MRHGLLDLLRSLWYYCCERLCTNASSELVSSGKAIVNVSIRKSGLPFEGCMEWPMRQDHH